MSLTPEVKGFFSPDLEYGREPDEPDNFFLHVEVDIGTKGGKAADIFSLNVVTPKALLNHSGYQWGRGWLLLEYFSWSQVESAVDELCAEVSGVSWEQIALELNKWLRWEYDNYKP